MDYKLVNKIARLIKLYFFPETLLTSEALKKYQIADNSKVRYHIMLLCCLTAVIYPAYYFFYDHQLNNGGETYFWFIFRFGSSAVSIISILFYLKFKNLNSPYYKMPIFILGFAVLLGHSVAYYYSDKLSSYMPFIILMVLVYASKMKPIVSILYATTACIMLYYFLLSSGIQSYLLASHCIVTAVVIILFTLRNYTSILQFKKLNDLNIKLESKNNFLENTYSQLVHDVKSPLMALKYLSDSDIEAKGLLKSATERVEKIILELENNQLIQYNNFEFNIVECISNIVNESKIKFKLILNEVVVKLEYSDDINKVRHVPVDKIVFSRIISNLVNNSFEAKNSPKHYININANLQGSIFSLLISDNGRGVTRNTLKKVFDGNYSTKGFNRGYGLSYAKRKIREVKGEFNINSKHGFSVLIKFDFVKK